MIITITNLFADKDGMIEFSASRAEGYTAEETWRNCIDYFDDNPLLVSTDDDVSELDDWLAGYGAWDDDERNTWSLRDYNALLLQFIAGDIRERQHYADRDELEEYEENCGGNIYVADDGSAEYYVGS